LLPAEPFAAAKVLELQTFIDLHLELVARELYGLAFFGGTLSEAHQARVREKLVRHIAGFKQLARFAPYVAGEQFTLADCSAWVNLPVIAMATKKVYGEDLLAAGGVDWKPYVDLVGQRPAAQRVAADRKAAQTAAVAEAAAKSAG
jgi:glutathione S-transferase